MINCRNETRKSIFDTSFEICDTEHTFIKGYKVGYWMKTSSSATFNTVLKT